MITGQLRNKNEIIGRLDRVIALRIAESIIDSDYGSETISFTTGPEQFAAISYDVGRFGLSGEKEESGRMIGFTSIVFIVRAIGNEDFKNKKNKVLFNEIDYNIKRVTSIGNSTDEFLAVFCESQE